MTTFFFDDKPGKLSCRFFCIDPDDALSKNSIQSRNQFQEDKAIENLPNP
jgi:hypothetical protein